MAGFSRCCDCASYGTETCWSCIHYRHGVKIGFIARDSFSMAFTNAISNLVIASKQENNRNTLDIDRVIFNNPATVVYWKDGTKTVVKANNEAFDKEKGLAMAIVKKALGNKSSYFEIFKEYCDE